MVTLQFFIALLLLRFHRVQRRNQSTKTSAMLPDIIEKAEKLRAKVTM